MYLNQIQSETCTISTNVSCYCTLYIVDSVHMSLFIYDYIFIKKTSYESKGYKI